MFDSSEFTTLVKKGQPTGEVVGVNRFLVTLIGLETAPIGGLILFENGQHGLVREVAEDHVIVLNLDSETIPIETLAVLAQDVFSVRAGEGMIGRVVTPLGQPIDGKGNIKYDATMPVFAQAPSVIERAIQKTQLVTGVSIVDMLFPIVMGQRMAILGDSKAGKSTFLRQLGTNQKGTHNVVVYVLIAKRNFDISMLVESLEESGAMARSIVVVANIFDSLVQSYIAPYTACAMAEYLWKNGTDVITIYDDLTSHAKIYRELSLLQRVNPGRDSYPGDMFYAHSSLLERAGKLASNNKTFTALPVVVTPNDDITSYLPTGIMSMTDGQLIFDLASFRNGIRPAVNAGLSVSRYGGRSQSQRAKQLSAELFKKLADYRQALEFSHFGSDLAIESQADLTLGKQIYEAFKQMPDELYNLTAQQLIIEAIVKGRGRAKINVIQLKKMATKAASSIKTEEEYLKALDAILAKTVVQAAK